MNNDLSHLKTLSILHYVYAGMNMLGGCFFIIYIAAGIMVTQASSPSELRRSGFDDFPRSSESEMFERDMDENFNTVTNTVGGIMICVFSGLMLLSFAIGFLNIMVGRNLAAQKGRTFCMVMSAINCIGIPLGTTLAIFTFVVLGRPTVVNLFEKGVVYK